MAFATLENFSFPLLQINLNKLSFRCADSTNHRPDLAAGFADLAGAGKGWL